MQLGPVQRDTEVVDDDGEILGMLAHQTVEPTRDDRVDRYAFLLREVVEDGDLITKETDGDGTRPLFTFLC